MRCVVTTTPPYCPTKLASPKGGSVLLTCRPGVVVVLNQADAEVRDSAASSKVVLHEEVVACPKPELPAMV